MDKQKKIIIVLLLSILILTGIFIYKVLTPRNNNTSNNTSNIAKNNNVVLDNTANTIRTTDSITPNLHTFNTKTIVSNVIDIIIILLVIPLLLKKFNLGVGVAVLTIWRLLKVFILGGFASFGSFIAIAIFLILYSYLLLSLVEKFLLDTNIITFVVGTFLLDGVLFYVTSFIFALIIARILV
jgi:hypothetical protein